MNEKQKAALEAWEKAKEATDRANDFIREAEAHHINCMALERQAWQCLKDSEWKHYKKAVQRVPIKWAGRPPTERKYA